MIPTVVSGAKLNLLKSLHVLCRGRAGLLRLFQTFRAFSKTSKSLFPSSFMTKFSPQHCCKEQRPLHVCIYRWALSSIITKFSKLWRMGLCLLSPSLLFSINMYLIPLSPSVYNPWLLHQWTLQIPFFPGQGPWCAQRHNAGKINIRFCFAIPSPC